MADKKLWADQRQAVAFLQDAIDVVSRAQDDGRGADVARGLVSIADVAGAAALAGEPLSMKELVSQASPDAVDFVISKQALPVNQRVPAAVATGRASLGMLKGKPEDEPDGGDL